MAEAFRLSIPKLNQVQGHKFTYEYSQPADYRFCQDSVILPSFVAKRIGDRAIKSVLDICAGCGVLGFELAHHLAHHPAHDVAHVGQMDFIELQAAFKPHFEENLRITHRDPTRFRWLNENYSCLLRPEFRERYDLIIGNPPYFLPTEGKLSPSTLRNRCRFFLDSDPETLVKGVANALKTGGSAFLLWKSGAQHGRQTFGRLSLAIDGIASLTEVAEIRGTSVIEIQKPLDR